MKQKVNLHISRKFQRTTLLCFFVLLCCVVNPSVLFADSSSSSNNRGYFGRKNSPGPRRTVFIGVPENYYQVGNTDLYYSRKEGHVYVGNVSIGSIDLIGKFGDYYYSSTYGDYGYVVSMQVNNNPASFADCLTGSNINGVTFWADVEAQGAMARMYYTVTNTNDTAVSVSLGVYDDVYVGNRIDASISRKFDTFGNTYGISLEDREGAQLCVLFGNGLTGITGIDDYWFGSYYLNADANAIAGNYSSGENYMVEHGQYDCGIGWCWKNRIINAGETKVFSFLIAVGDVNLEPGSSFEVTPDDPEGWNDLSRPHRLTLTGLYESPAGLGGFIDYAVEDSEEWTAMTDTLESGAEFTGSLVAMFDASKSIHEIKFRTRDLVGNTTQLPSILYKDVSFHNLTGIEEKTFTGDSIYQTNLTCDLDYEQYIISHYQNNVNAGTASFNLEGVFPYTIGRRTYTFTINPQLFSGELLLDETAFVYNGQSFTPNWQFTNNNYAELEYDKDYTIDWSNNKLPGTASLTVTGKNNYTGSLSANFTIDKAQLVDDLFTLILPNEDITYDEQAHGASITKSEGVGEATISYLKQGETERTTTQPIEAGDYTIYLEFADGTLYYGRALSQVGSFAIYQFNADEWAILQTVLPQLKEMGWSEPWDASQGMKCVSSIQGLNIEKGHVTGFDLNNQNLTGAFPFAILTLPQLESVDLSNNNLSGDLGTDTYAFTQQYPELTTNIKTLNISHNQLSGNVSPFANIFPSLTSLNASENCFEDVFPAISPSVTELDISKQTISRIIPFDLESLFEDDITANVPTILLYDHVNQTYLDDINLLCTTPDNSWGMTLSYLNGQLTIPTVSGQNTYYGESGDMLNVAITYKYVTREGSDFRIQLYFNEGDGNFDGQVNVLDLQTSILYIMEKYPTRPFNFTAANLWKDDVINVQDIICQVNQLMTTEEEQAQAANARRNAPSSTVTDDAFVYVQDGKLVFNSNQPVAAFDLRINGANRLYPVNNLEQMGMTFVTMEETEGLHVIAYSMNGACIPSGTSVIGTVDSNTATLSHAMLSDSEANAITVSFSGMTTAIENINTPANNQKAAYDMQGRQVNESTHKGLYIKNGQKIIK